MSKHACNQKQKRKCFKILKTFFSEKNKIIKQKIKHKFKIISELFRQKSFHDINHLDSAVSFLRNNSRMRGIESSVNQE